MDLSTLCDTKRCMQANACLLCALLFEAKTTCFTGGGDFGSDLYMASLMGGTVRGSAMPAGNHVRMRRAVQFVPATSKHCKLSHPVLTHS